ncbi:MAG TPA: sulfatase [Gammaproteobacteria bacterium]|jgi:arylsulfatase A-like enzyme
MSSKRSPAGGVFRLLYATQALAVGLALSACSGTDAPDAPRLIRLQDIFDSAEVSGSPPPPGLAPTVLQFDGSGEFEWASGPGVDNLSVENGNLVGATTDIVPFIHIERTGDIDNGDTLYQIEIRARVSADTRMGINLSAQPPNYPAIVSRIQTNGWPMMLDVTAADEIQTYTIAANQSGNIQAASMRHVLIRPASVEGAEFEIESIRFTYLQEHLASIPSGIGWQGLANRYHETIITRAPERVSFDIELPENPWLDLSVGTLEESPVTFRVTAESGDDAVVLGEQVVAESNSWQLMPLDLAAFAGQSVRLELELEAERDNAIGFWGSPVVRNRMLAQASTDDPPRGVILFLADTLRSDHLSAYGYERDTSPTLERLTEQGAIVLDAQSHAIWTKVSVPAIHTSLYPRTNTVQRFFDLLPHTATTIAEVYREAGYATLGLSSNNFMGRATNLHQGYEEFHESTSIVGGGPFSKSTRPFVDRVIPWIEAHRDGPFFINIHVTDPHSPYPGYEPYDTMYGDDASRAAFQDMQARLREAVPGAFGGGPNGEPKTATFEAAGIDPEPYLQQEKNWYDGSIRAMDDEIGRLMDSLDEMGLSDDVLFVFISDHGEEFLDRDSHFHLQIYGANSNVPLILWAPGRIEAGTRIRDTLQSIDMMPTMLELSGLAVPEAAQGQSFLSLLEPRQLASSGVAYAQEPWQPTPVFTEQLRDDNGPEPGPFPRDAYAVIDGGWKLVHNVYIPEGMDYPEYELFDHANDPLDQINLADANPEVVARLSQLIDDWLTYALAVQLEPEESSAEGLSPAERQRLCALGYIAC